MSAQPTFDVHTDPDSAPGETLLVGFSEFGLAGLTAVDYLVDQLDLSPIGYLTAEGLATITPFEDGTPRHHTRLYSDPDHELTVLVGELVATQLAAGAFSRTLTAWLQRTAGEEVTLLTGIPIAHGPDDHRTFYVATEDYQRHRLDGVDVPPMGGGFLDGVGAHLMAAGMETSLRVGVFTTPVHPQHPDAEAALRLLGAVDQAYGLDLDMGPLESFAADVASHYEELAERISQASDEASLPVDRMYM